MRKKTEPMKIKRIIPTYILFTIFIFVFDKVYALFGHGVTSSWMSNAYLYLLGFGAGGWLLIIFLTPNIEKQKHFSLFYIVYNSGVAILINAMLLLGIIEIAGGTSSYANWYLYIGYALIAAAIVIFISIVLQKTSNIKK